jgi:hypothetical protein
MPRVPKKIVAQNRSPEEDVLTALLALAGLPDAATTSIANGTNSPRPDTLRTRLPCPALPGEEVRSERRVDPADSR